MTRCASSFRLFNVIFMTELNQGLRPRAGINMVRGVHVLSKQVIFELKV